MMRDTIHCLTETVPEEDKIRASVEEMPGYRLLHKIVFDGNRVSIFVEVEGLGDYLPKYAGNLDIMTAAASRTAEMIGEEIASGRFTPSAALATA